jgi:hypothetical protein
MIYVIRVQPVVSALDLEPTDDVLAGYACAALLAQGWRVNVIDLVLDPAATGRLAQVGSNDICVFPVRQYDDQVHFAVSVAAQIKSRQPAAVTIASGHAQVACDLLLSSGAIDYVVTGEEPDLVGLVRSILDGGSAEHATGTAWRGEDGRNRQTAPCAPVDMDDLHLPSRYALAQGLLPGEHPDATFEIQTSRGCYARCTYCYVDALRVSFEAPKFWRQRSPASVVAEVRRLAEHARRFTFYDANFFAPGRRGQEHALEIADGLTAIGGVRFGIYARANDIVETTLSALARAGLFRVYIGIESFSDTQLKRWHKGVNAEVNRRALEICHRVGVTPAIGFVLFDHDTTLDEVAETLTGLRWILRNFPASLPEPAYLFGLIEPLPLTAIHSDYAARGLLSPSSGGLWQDGFVGTLGSYRLKDPRVEALCGWCRRLGTFLTDEVRRRFGAAAHDPRARFDRMTSMFTLNEIALGALGDALEAARATRPGELGNVLEGLFAQTASAISGQVGAAHA